MSSSISLRVLDLRHVVAVDRLQLGLDVCHDRGNLLLGDPGALHPDRLARSHRQEERIALADQLLSARLVEDHPTVRQATTLRTQVDWERSP